KSGSQRRGVTRVVAGKGGLGRGLGSLIPASDDGVGEISIAQIQPNPRQPRHLVDAAEVAELAASIRDHGVLQPIVVTRAEDTEGYVLIAGERRWLAAKLAGLDRIPAVVKDVTPQGMLELALVENIQRADLNPLEEAAAFQQLMAEFGLTQEQVARRVGRSRPTIANSVRLLGLPDVVQHALARGEISEGHARALLGATEPSDLRDLFRQVVDGELSVRQTEELVRRRRQVVPTPIVREEPPVDFEARQIEQLFRDALGTRVEVIRRGTGGRLIIHFYNDEQLQGLYEAVTRS
ncbi:MAG TPA: ParB/RepB/Spo0J family partition protein, partial [Chloroflexota bacterium]|nr:ParB/RepB/Spo0J family partition protein [Chloroflexota bacterium]